MANSRRLVQLHTGRKIGLHAFARRRDGRLFLVLRSCSRRQRSPISACNKRNKESGCATLNGTSCDRAVLGTSNLCIANYPGDWGGGPGGVRHGYRGTISRHQQGHPVR